MLQRLVYKLEIVPVWLMKRGKQDLWFWIRSYPSPAVLSDRKSMQPGLYNSCRGGCKVEDTKITYESSL